ncbi:hypothetical protein L1281_001779 [Neisseria sp. HSC-16F19]|nr:hypothetical protein [Neisseria sp. HSC-16F19]MCP2041185.1 hypothetical protein [Neisseria sp. HSC-16F19]
MHHLTTAQENVLIALASDCMHDLALFGYSPAYQSQIQSLAKHCLQGFFNDKRGRLDYSGFKETLHTLDAALCHRLAVYEHNPYYREYAFGETVPQNWAQAWQAISQTAVKLYTLEGLTHTVDEAVLTALSCMNEDWWQGNIWDDARIRVRASVTTWDEQLASFLDYGDDGLEILAMRVFAHPPDIAFLYHWCTHMGMAHYATVKNFMMREIRHTWPAFDEDAFLFF